MPKHTVEMLLQIEIYHVYINLLSLEIDPTVAIHIVRAYNTSIALMDSESENFRI